jgi:transposase
MDQVYVVRHKVLVEGLGVRRVAREMGLSRNTVRKYLGQSEPVRAPERRPRPCPVRERVAPRIDELLENWRERTTAKQRITGTRIHRQLLEEGLSAGTSLVRRVLREIARREAEVFVPLVHRPGDEAQVDFFEVTVDVEGLRRKAWKFLVRLMYSGRDFAWLYERCDQLSFLDGHVRAFEHLGAIPHRLIYDNLTAAVRKVTFPGRELTGRFQALVSHYLFEPCFARVGAGHDKGGVESRGKGIRLRHLVPIPQGQSLEEIASELLQGIEREASEKRDREGKTILERFEAEEKARMLTLPATPFEVRRVEPVTVSSKALVKVEGAYYSVPSGWARLAATAYLGVKDVAIVCRGERVTHERQRFGEKRIAYRHYLPELAKKPQAVRQVAAELLGELGEPYGELWRLLVDTHGPREAARIFARVLGAVVAHGEEPVGRALRASLKAGRLDLLSLASAFSETSTAPKTIAVPPALESYDVERARAADYDHLLAADGGDADE